MKTGPLDRRDQLKMNRYCFSYGPLWFPVVGSLVLLISLNGCQQKTPSPEPAQDQPGSVAGSSSTEGAEKKTGGQGETPRIPGYLTEESRKQLLRESFKFEESSEPVPMVEAPSGLKYRILLPGNDKKVQDSGSFCVHFVGLLANGQEFDRLITDTEVGGIPRKDGSQAVFNLAKVMPGWREAIPLIGEGGIIEMEVPPQLGYGEKGSRNVPANARLFIIVQLLNAAPKSEQFIVSEMIKNEGYERAPSGVYFKIIKQTEGPKPTFTDDVTFHYSVQLMDGKMAINTFGGTEPTPKGGVIVMREGLAKGIRLIGEGGVVDLLLSPKQGFGKESDHPAVPDNSWVKVRMELLKVEPNTRLKLPKNKTGLPASGDQSQGTDQGANKNEAPGTDAPEPLTQPEKSDAEPKSVPPEK